MSRTIRLIWWNRAPAMSGLPKSPSQRPEWAARRRRSSAGEILGPQVGAGAHADIVDIRRQPGFGRAPAAILQLQQEIPIGVELGVDREILQPAVGADRVDQDAPVGLARLG